MTKIFFIAMVAVVSLFAPNAMAQNFMKSFAMCKKITVAEERLACFDALDAPQRPARNNTRPMPEVMDSRIEDTHESSSKERHDTSEKVNSDLDPQLPQTKSEADFGIVKRVETESDKLDKITGVVAEITTSALKKRIIHLETGAVWMQMDRGYLKLKPGMKVYIERGVLSAFFLSVDGVNTRIKVKRIK